MLKTKRITNKDVYAVVGASKNSSKYGYRVLKYLKDSGYQVIPINPKEKIILGLKVYAKLSDIKIKIDIVIFVVPPQVTEKVLLDVKELKIKKVWLQPGSESQQAIDFCNKNKIECIHHACIIVETQY